jgi:hypothetical protein
MDPKHEPSNGSGDAGDASRAGRSKLLLEAVPEKAEQHNGVAFVKEEAGSPDAPVAQAVDGHSASAAAASGSGSAQNSASYKEEQTGLQQGGTLFEKLREAGGEAV